MTKLVGDPARQAHATLRGYVYQILRSIVVWLDLSDSEELYLEGAEDLDRIDGESALTEQVKDTTGSGNITLRTTSVVEAISNFWTHTTRNPGTAVRFRYVTTSGIGVEQGAPFGPGRAGLDLWNALRTDLNGVGAEDDAASLATFLMEQNAVAVPVRDFLVSASPRQLLERVIIPIEWLAGQRDGSALVQQIKDRLVVHGHALGVAPADAEFAFDALYTAAFDAAKRRDAIPLTRAQFLRIFAGATTVQISKQELLALLRTTVAPEQASSATVQAAVSLEGPPPLPDRYLRRASHERDLEASLGGGAVLLYGSTGSGKTLTAASTLVGREPLWLNLRDLNGAETRSLLKASRDVLHVEGKARTLIVDDLDTLADPRLIESALRALWNCQKSLGGRLIVTADRPLPARLAQAIELDASRELRMQPFDAVEIEVFLRQSGCPDDRALVWSKLLEVSTLGHPQLVSARLASLIADQFPEPLPEDLFQTSKDVDRIRFEARRLIGQLPDGARELLLRASLMTGRMDRQRLLAIARIQEAIVEPGAAVDIVAGPWLEIISDREYRVSPLARGAAEELRGNTWVKIMHGQLAWTYLLDRKITPWDISSVLTHCCIAGTAGPLAHVMLGIFSAPEEAWGPIGDACAIFTTLGIKAGTSVPFERPVDLFVFRILQYRIAAETAPETAMRIALTIEEEFGATPDDDSKRFFRFLYLSQFLLVTKVKYPIGVIVARALEFRDALESTLPEQMARAGMTSEDDLPSERFAQLMGLRLAAQVEDIDDLANFVGALRNRGPEDVRSMLDSIGKPEDISTVVIERVWLREHEAKRDRWPEFRTKLRATFDLAVEVDSQSFARAIAPILLRTINEDIGDPSGAIAEADQLGRIVGDDPVYRCALAKVKSDAGDFQQALEIWREALPKWPRAEGDIGSAFAYRAAAVAAGKNGVWAEAARFFDAAMKLVANGDRPTFTIGLAMDAAFSRFMAGERGVAATEFGGVVATLEPMQAAYDLEPLLSLQRRAGGVLSAIAGWTEGERTDEELTKLVGICSNLDPFVTEASVAPPLDMLRMDLIRIEIAHGASLEGALREAPKLRESPFLPFRAASGGTLFQLALRTLDFSHVVDDGLRQLDALAMAAEEFANEHREVMRRFDGQQRTWRSGADELLIGNIVVALFALAAANELDRLPLDQWRRDATAHPQANRIVGLIDHVDGLFVTGKVDAWATVLNSPAPDWSIHVASALAATMLEPLTADALLRCHALWVHYFGQPHLHTLVATPVAQLVSREWRAVSEAPASLGAPRSGLLRLRAAIAEPSEGWKKTRVVLEAALEGCPLPLGDTARSTIQGMA